MIQKYIISKDADMLAPNWLADRINYKTVKFLYGIHDGAEVLKGVRINDQTAKPVMRFTLMQNVNWWQSKIKEQEILFP